MTTQGLVANMAIHSCVMCPQILGDHLQRPLICKDCLDIGFLLLESLKKEFCSIGAPVDNCGPGLVITPWNYVRETAGLVQLCFLHVTLAWVELQPSNLSHDGLKSSIDDEGGF